MSARRSYRRFSWRGLRRASAYAARIGNATVLSRYATTVPGSLSGATLPQLTASDGVAPDRPPVSGRASVSCKERSEEHTSELQSQSNIVFRRLLEKKKQ